jgi:hypothetical protein
MTTNDGTVQRNFLIPSAQAEWLREHAFRTRRSQADIVREALAAYQAHAESASGSAGHERNRALVARFTQGRGIDLDVLRDADGEMWRRER